jgi:hypothetical protein
LAENDTYQPGDYDGGDSLASGTDLSGGSSAYALSPVGATGNDFFTRYTNVAKLKDQLVLIHETFRRFNTQPSLEFIGDSVVVSRKAEVLDSLSLSDFFHPLLDFSEYQKQTFVINPRTSVNIDNSSFQTTNGEVSMIIAKAEYLPEAKDGDRILFWDYTGSDRNPMGQIMVLTGAVKNGSTWHGWDVNPFSSYGNTGPADTSNSGLSFTNPTELNVKLTIIIAS